MVPTHSLTHWLIIAGLLVAGVLVVIGMIRSLRAGRADADPEASPLYRVPLAILLTVCAYLFVADDRDAIDAAIARERAFLSLFSVERCPERRPGDADAIVITIHSYADGRPEDRRMSCARIPQRAYELKFPHRGPQYTAAQLQ